MSAWLEILNVQQKSSIEAAATAETPKTTTTTRTTASTKNTRQASNSSRRGQHARTLKTQTGGNAGRFKSIVDVLAAKFKSAYATAATDYARLQQADAELGESSDGNDAASGNGSGSSSSEEQLFVNATPRRKQLRRKMVRGSKGAYSMRGGGGGENGSEGSSSRQYLPATHQYLHHYKQSSQQPHQQQQQCVLHIPLQQQKQQHQQQQQQHQQQQQQQQQQHQWMSYSSAEIDDYYWQQQQQQTNNCSSSIGSAKTFITPGDIPPPPPHPAAALNSASGGSGKRFQGSIQRQRSITRCHCEHPIEVVPQQQQQHPNHIQSLPPPPLSSTAQLQRPTPSRSNYPQHEPLPSPLLLPREHQQHHQHFSHSHSQPQQQQQQHTHSHAQQYSKKPGSHLHHHRNPDQLQGLASSSSSLRHSIVGSSKAADASRMKNLVYSQMKIRRLRIILGVVFGLILLALLGTAIYFIVKGSDGESKAPESSGNGIHLEDVLTGQLAARRFNGSWSTGTNVIYKENNSILEYDVKAKRKTALLYDEHQQYVSYEKSADGQLLLLAKNFKKNFRHSFEAQYDIYNITSGQVQPLNVKGDQKFVIMAQWAPVGNGLIINFERNLYYKPNAYAAEIAITEDENPAVLNGIPDWVYEEEVFSSNSATWFNPNGTMIAFIRFDDSPTHVINFPYYGEAGDLRYQYPFNRLVAYPKAGSSNPRVSLFTADLVRAAQGLEHLTEIPVPSALNTETDYIITVVDWLDNNHVLSVWMNRIQNLAYLEVFDGLKRYQIYNMESKTGWVDLYSTPFKNRDGTRIALILPQAQDDEGFYRHLCTLSTTTGISSPEVLTKGKYVVQSILHWDFASDIIFYTANTEPNSEILHVYAVRAHTGQTPKCLTCKLQKSGDVEQTYYTADFNTEHQVVISSSGPGIPMHAIYEWSYSNNQINLQKIMNWETNEHLHSKLKNTAMPTSEIHTIPIAGGFTAKVLLQLPPNMDRSGKTKYPMLVDVYGGPDSYSVVNKWILDWGTYLSSNQSVIYAKIDGRGSGLRGEKLLHSIYLKLGTVEISDQIEVARQLQQKFAFIDAEHTGIWGWSYGGYAAAMALANDDTFVFRCAASIAPVTDWAYYDSIYTERYMSLPKLNEIGYSNSRLSTRAQKLRGKKFLLVHGTLDDNVHYQQAMILAKNLERNDILFKQISYPDEDHGLAGVRPHLYHSLDRFFGECFASKRMMGTK